MANFECELDSKFDGIKICHVKTDANGKFTFGNVAFGKYQLRSSLTKNGFEFSMQPETLLVDLTRHQNVYVDKPFVLDAVTVPSQFFLSEKLKKPLISGQVYVNEQKLG